MKFKPPKPISALAMTQVILMFNLRDRGPNVTRLSCRAYCAAKWKGRRVF